MLLISRYVVSFWAGVAVLVAGIVLLASLLSRFPAGRRMKESIWMIVPVLGQVYRVSQLSRLADSMALMVGAGMDMPACLRLGASASLSQRIHDDCERLAGQLEQGQSIADGSTVSSPPNGGSFCRTLPPLFLYSVQMGYQRNELQENLYSLSEMYAQQARTSQSRLSALLLPFMLIVVGGLVAFFVTALFIPLPVMLQKMASY